MRSLHPAKIPTAFYLVTRAEEIPKDSFSDRRGNVLLKPKDVKKVVTLDVGGTHYTVLLTLWRTYIVVHRNSYGV